ncbi:hypothetical protein SRHO_G00295790 [Serrasalmus rhombeus]
MKDVNGSRQARRTAGPAGSLTEQLIWGGQVHELLQAETSVMAEGHQNHTNLAPQQRQDEPKQCLRNVCEDLYVYLSQ